MAQKNKSKTLPNIIGTIKTKAVNINQKNLNHGFIIIYLMGCLIVSIFLFITDRNRLMLSLTSPLFILAPLLLETIFKLKRNYLLNNMFYVFVFFAFCIGTVAGVYLKSQVYDKIVHLISGSLFFAIGAYVYELMHSTDFKSMSQKPIAERRFYLFFSVLFSMASEYLWEIYEYFYEAVTGEDCQHVLDTGINDTMQDMISCILGALLGMGIYIYLMRLSRRRSGIK